MLARRFHRKCRCFFTEEQCCPHSHSSEIVTADWGLSCEPWGQWWGKVLSGGPSSTPRVPREAGQGRRCCSPVSCSEMGWPTATCMRSSKQQHFVTKTLEEPTAAWDHMDVRGKLLTLGLQYFTHCLYYLCLGNGLAAPLVLGLKARTI